MSRVFITRVMASILTFSLLASSAFSDDWSQFLGPSRNGVSSEVGLLDAFESSGPTIRWRVAGGVGMSAIAVRGETATTTWNANGKQWLVAIDTKNGKEKWKAELGDAYENSMGDGPRATPTMTMDKVFAYSGEGILIAADLHSGKIVWRKNILEELSASPSEYGMASSPLVVGDRVIVHTGAEDAAVVALATQDGKLLWRCGKGHAGYSSPTLFELEKTSQIVTVSGTSVMGIDPNTGKQLWSYPFETDYGCNTASPVLIDGGIFISAGENHGAVLLDVKLNNGQYKISERWKSLESKSVMRNEWQTSIVIGDHLYGFDNVGAAGPVTHFSCIEAKTGKAVWQKTRFGKGNLTYADGKFWITTLEGELIIAKADPKGFQELSRVALLGKNRQTISISAGFGYLRDDNEVLCIKLRQ